MRKDKLVKEVRMEGESRDSEEEEKRGNNLFTRTSRECEELGKRE